MKEYELVNPSDPYTFLAADHETAALAVFLLGTAYGATQKDRTEGEDVPIFILGGGVEWYTEKFSRSPDDGLAAKQSEVAEALGSMMLGHFEDRRRYNAALEAIDDPEKKAKFIADWQDGRSSLNDIGTKAHRIAEILRRAQEKE